MKEREFKTIGEYFYWAYSNMAMSHVALKNSHTKYERQDFMIRAKLYKGLCSGTMSISSLYDDEKTKLTSNFCCYCGSIKNLSLDHLIPRKKGGRDCSDNLIFCCKTCNSSKNKSDLIQWCLTRGTFPPILLLRRYLKLTNTDFEERDIFVLPIDQLIENQGVFRIDLLPYSFPSPLNLKL